MESAPTDQVPGIAAAARGEPAAGPGVAAAAEERAPVPEPAPAEEPGPGVESASGATSSPLRNRTYAVAPPPTTSSRTARRARPVIREVIGGWFGLAVRSF